MQHARRLGDIVGVESLAGDMQDGAVMRQGLAHLRRG
jgi:hypothetical protein